jgi:hypothetical protein
MADFPMSVIDILHVRFTELFTDRSIVDRSLRPTDPARSIGLFPVDWTPDLESFEMPQFEPTLGRYAYRVQTLVKHTNEEEGRAIYAKDAKIIRAIIMRDQTLRSRLTSVQEVTLGYRERVKRWGIRGTRYLNNEISGQFIFLATTDLWVECESVPQ